MIESDARLLATLARLAELLEAMHHPRAAWVADQVERFEQDPRRGRRALDQNDWWAGAGSLAAATMADNPGLPEPLWNQYTRECRSLMIDLGETLQAHGAANPGLSSWLLAFNNWNASEV